MDLEQKRMATWNRWVACIARSATVFALVIAQVVQAAPAPGTLISNQASGSAQAGGSGLNRSSNIVNAIVNGVPGAPGAALAYSQVLTTDPGQTLFVGHTLTNTGSSADTFTLSAGSASLGGWSFTSITLFADANNDGIPDSATPLGPVALAAGQVFRFVARYVVPATAQPQSTNLVTLTATAASAVPIAPISDTISIRAGLVPLDCATVTKMLSRERGPSPFGPLTVTLTYNACDKPRARIVLEDRLPSGMKYIAGSARWTGTGATVLTDAGADDRQGTAPAQVAFDYGVTTPGAVTATVFSVPAGGGGSLTFDVQVAGGLANGTAVPNGASYTLYDNNNVYSGMSPTNTATYTVSSQADFTLVGDRLDNVAPGSTVSFANVLTNKGEAPDTYDITLSDSTFPPGTVLSLFKSDGVTPLADTDGSGVPDTGVVAAGATYRIVVKATLPASILPGSYKVTKTARSGAMRIVTVSVEDVVGSVANKCAVSLDPDNNAQVGFGQHVTYTHYLTNRGNCSEVVRATLEYLADSRPGWASKVYIDNRASGGASIPGAVDPTDAMVSPGWTTTLAPGESLRILVDVTAPTLEAMAAKAATKATGDTNVTTVVINSTTSGALTVRDTTIVQDKAGPADGQDVIRNFVDASYGAPTAWVVQGGALWLKADAASCNLTNAIDSRIVVITGPNGEREEFLATETGASTGIFTVPGVQVRAPPVKAGDGVLQGAAGDVFEVELLGCGRRISTLVTVIEPRNVVFDSRSNDPVAGARVTLLQASGSSCTATPVTGAGPNPVTTGSDGRFTFNWPQGSYCLGVVPPNGYAAPSQVAWPQLPAGRNLVVNGLTSGGSYGGAFSIGAGVLVIDIPVDTAAQDGLFVQKAASRSVVELGEMVDYVVKVRNGTGNALSQADVMLSDDLPAGFAFVKGTARRDGRAIADPDGGAGPRLTLRLGTMARGDEAVVSYRVRVGPGAARGDGVNRVQARYAPAGGTATVSNIATAKVIVTGGVFSDKGFILGKVFMDCNANGVQDKDEPGMPGVRLVLEDGTSAVTDGLGKYSFYGLANRAHVLKADRTTLPIGARLVAASARNLGDGGSRIVDLKSGEMQRADFVIEGCHPALREEAKARVEAAAKFDELAAMMASQVATEPRAVSDVKALPAAGTVTLQAAPGLAPTTGVGTAGFNAVDPLGTSPRPSPAPGLAGATAATTAAAAETLAPLEDVLPTVDNKLGFMNLVDGQVLGYAQATVRVKGNAGSTLSLKVNGEEVPARRVGKRSTLPEKQVQGWEYIGVPLLAGENTLVLAQVDSFGNPRGNVTIKVVAPGELAKVVLDLPGGAVADGKTPVKIVVRLQDAKGTPVTSRTPVTIDAGNHFWKTGDLDPTEPGLQVMAEGGRVEVELLPPAEPGSTQVAAASGVHKAEGRLDFLPELRQMIAAGVLEGIINGRRISRDAITAARPGDAFEQELRHISKDWNDGKTQAAARAALFLKGKIKGDYLLTAAYDSDKDTRERLFRDIQPDEFYPIYGDSAVRGFDAQSTSRLYVRVDKNRSYLLWGDFTTQVTSEARKLSNYNRSLTGAKQHYENDRVSVNAFASRDSTRQVIDELRANGTSGPYLLGTPNALVNSEKVEIIVRDRSQPSLILGATAQSRFSDYEIEALTGRILFKAPVASIDKDLNPVFIRVTYEVDQGGPEFWVAGVDAQVKVTDKIEVGGVYVKDKNPLAPFTMAGANATVKLGAATTVQGEVARTEHGVNEKQGDAARIELKHEGTDLKGQAFVARTDRDFDNPGAYLTQGRSEAGGKLEYKITPRTSVKAEALRTEDVANNSSRDGLAASIRHQLHDRLTLELGVRHASEKGAASPIPTIAAPGGGSVVAQPIPDEVTAVRAKAIGSIPGVEGLTVFGEAEVDVHDTDRRMLAAGAEYQLANKGRVYARHEFISSLTGPYGLNQNERQNTTAVGVDTDYMKDGRLYSEYRVRDVMSGGDVEAALGLKNLWSIAPGLKAGTTFERVKALSGTGQNENTAFSVALEYTGSPTWKGSTRLEIRDSKASDALLFTVGLAARISQDWTALARNAYTITRNKDGAGEHLIDRMQAGVAWRDSEANRWNALARVEQRVERDSMTQGVDLKTDTTIVSVHADWQPRRPFLLSGRYAAKWTTDKSNGLTAKYRAQVVGGRATWEFAPKWDVSLVTSALFGDGSQSRQYGVGIEVGYLIATNLWVSAGYNVLGYRDADLAGADYTAKGPFVRLRYKFDEAVIEQATSAVTAKSEAAK